VRSSLSLLLRLLAPSLLPLAVLGASLYMYAAPAASRRAPLIALAVAGVASLCAVLVLARRLSARVARLADFSTAVARGEHPPALLPEDHSLIGQVETQLVTMANGLREQLSAAREEKDKLEAVLRGMVEGVLVVDRAGTIRLCNQRAEELFGLAAHEPLIGRKLIAVSRDPDLHDLVRDCAEAAAVQPAIREITFDGGREHLQVTATAIAEPDLEPRLFILVFHDVTRLKRLEAMRRDFVANVSHELRTPLTAIRGYSETLLSGALDDPDSARRFLSIIERHAERLGRLVEDLLTLSDLELGHTDLERRAVPVAAMVASALEVFRSRAGQAGITLREEIAPALPPLDADPDRIQQVLVNLVDNALKYTPQGGAVTVRARPVPAAHLPQTLTEPIRGEYVAIVIEDTGSGIPPADLPRLTERFYRVDKARSRELGGTGLGLAIVKYIVQAHGGALRIESEVNRGTRVLVYLPTAIDPGPR